jgi:hypothetical protein
MSRFNECNKMSWNNYEVSKKTQSKPHFMLLSVESNREIG